MNKNKTCKLISDSVEGIKMIECQKRYPFIQSSKQNTNILRFRGYF